LEAERREKAMSLVHTEKEQLAGPRRLEELPPPPFDFAEPQDEVQSRKKLPVMDIVPDSFEAQEPSFLVSARALVASSSDSAMARSRLAQAEMAFGARDEASRHALEALELASAERDNSAVFSATRTLMAAGALGRAEKALANFVKPGPLTILYAMLAAQRGDLDVAFDRLEDDTSIDAWELRGWIALQQAHFDQAIRFYRKAMRSADPGPALLANLGLAHAALGAPKKAIAETKRALALGPLQRRRVALNLVAYLFSVGSSDEGFHELRKLQEGFPTDIELVFAEAHWALAVGDAERAERRLRYARTSLWSFASEVQQAELQANRAYLRYYKGEISSDRAADEVISQMRRTKWESTRLVSMIPILLDHYSDVQRLSRVRDEVAHAHPELTFRDLDLHLAILRDETQEATRLALHWTDEALFSPEASTWAIFMLTQVEDHIEEAIKIGKKALRRMPAAVVVANNTAYSMALNGEVEQAKRLLRREEDGAMIDLATQGLLWAVKGDVQEANRLYDCAQSAAEENGSASAPLLVNLHRRLIAVVAPDTDSAFASKPVTLPQDWDDFPALVLCLRMLKHRGAPLGDIEIEGGGALPDVIEPREKKRLVH
jgi:tetratricopeptide (TPR) repeat protein